MPLAFNRLTLLNRKFWSFSWLAISFSDWARFIWKSGFLVLPLLLAWARRCFGSWGLRVHSCGIGHLIAEDLSGLS